jgi:hypothetical protein
MMAENDSGNEIMLKADAHQHLEISVHKPTNPFGSLNVSELHPIFQHDAVYGINANNILSTVNASGTAGASDGAFVCTTGTTIYGAGSITSLERAIYRPGQGIVGRFTASFTTPIANSYQIGGFGSPEDGVYIGAVGATNGLLYSTRGAREVQTLTISTKSSTAENMTVTLNGTNFTVAVTNGASTVTTAYEISQGTYTGWRAESIGSTVVFIAQTVGDKTGSFSITASTAIGSFAETRAGVALTEVFVSQSSFNMDTLDGNGPSGLIIDWTKLNVFQVHIQFLGAGACTWFVQHCPEGNDPVWLPFHTFAFPNSRTQTNFRNPTFQFQLTAYSAGSSGTNLTVKCGSFAAFNEGNRSIHGDRYSYINSSTGVGAAVYLPLFTIRNTRYFGGITNQSVIKILDVGASIKHTSPVVIYLFKNATLVGSPNFSQYSSSSISYVDTAATSCTISDNSKLIWSGPLGETGELFHEFNGQEIRVLPGDTITVAARSITGTPAYVVCTLNTKEFQ